MSAKKRGLAGALAAVLITAGCAGEPAESGGSGLEKPTIRVGTMPIVDTAPLQLAIESGLFEKEGLALELEELAGGAESIPKLKGGSLDISFGNYVSFLSAQSKGVLDLRFASDGFQSAEGTHVIMTRDSSIQGVKDLEGKKVGVNTKRNISTMLVRSAAEEEGIQLDEDQNFVEFPMPQLGTALRNKSVDAVLAVEPFVTQIEGEGGRALWDTSQGDTEEFPIAGYATTAEFAEENPKTVAAFQRAMAAGQKMAADHDAVAEIVPKYTKIDAKIVGDLAIGGFPEELEAERLQRVGDLMAAMGLLDSAVEVQPLIFAPE